MVSSDRFLDKCLGNRLPRSGPSVLVPRSETHQRSGEEYVCWVIRVLNVLPECVKGRRKREGPRRRPGVYRPGLHVPIYYGYPSWTAVTLSLDLLSNKEKGRVFLIWLLVGEYTRDPSIWVFRLIYQRELLSPPLKRSRGTRPDDGKGSDDEDPNVKNYSPSCVRTTESETTDFGSGTRRKTFLLQSTFTFVVCFSFSSDPCYLRCHWLRLTPLTLSEVPFRNLWLKSMCSLAAVGPSLQFATLLTLVPGDTSSIQVVLMLSDHGSERKPRGKSLTTSNWPLFVGGNVEGNSDLTKDYTPE